MKKFITKNWSTILLVGVFIVGLSLLLYPTISEWWNASRASRVIGGYNSVVDQMDSAEAEKMLEEARQYNADLLKEQNRYFPSEELHARYESLLSLDGNGLMGSIEIPSVKIKLPLYHGLEEEILQQNIGHIEGTSLPVGGESTHAVVSGHRGLPSAKLFTDLDQLETGDVFLFRILGKTYTYEIDQIRTVLPEEVQDLEIEEGKDLATLVTCTPYGINSHRLLFRGHRVENRTEDFVNFGAEVQLVDKHIVAISIGVILLIGIAIWMGVKRKIGK